MTDTYKVQLSDDLVATMLIATYQQPRGGGCVQTLVAAAVKAGRQIGKLEALEPLDDAARTAVDQELLDLVPAGRFGWLQALRRLQGFLQRYPVRGRPEGSPEASGAPASGFPAHVAAVVE